MLDPTVSLIFVIMREDHVRGQAAGNAAASNRLEVNVFEVPKMADTFDLTDTHEGMLSENIFRGDSHPNLALGKSLSSKNNHCLSPSDLENPFPVSPY